MASLVANASRGLARFFYINDVNATSFEKIEDVPNYVNEALPFFLSLIVVEHFVIWLKGGIVYPRLNDSITSVSMGMIQTIVSLIVRGSEHLVYFYLYSNYRLFSLPWNSPYTWWGCAIGIDLGYYWFHRASHEVSLVWASHQVHHSSEFYNLTTALRQSMVQQYFSWVVYLPLAVLGVPPPQYLTHIQFNLLYQFWIHTEVINKLGPLEFIFNTPSHHRVHHGANIKYLDRNYGGVLIIWDRMFGTFQAEEEEVVYGLVTNVESFNPVYIQLCYFRWLWSEFRSMEGWTNKFRRLANGPGWVPGAPRLGDPSTFPSITAPRVKYNVILPLWCNVYLAIHFAIVNIAFMIFAPAYKGLDAMMKLCFILYVLVSLTSIGHILEQKWYASLLEACRCAACCLYFTLVPQAGTLAALVYGYFLLSTLIWLGQSSSLVKLAVKTKQVKSE